MLDEGVWAEVKVGAEHLRLFSEQNARGVSGVPVYNVNSKNWIAPSENVDDIESGKDRATAHAIASVQRVAKTRTPPTPMEKLPLRLNVVAEL